jgi:hypothetical protein
MAITLDPATKVYSIPQADLSLHWSVRLERSNTDYFDSEAGVRNQNQVQVIPTHSAGLIVNEGQSLGQADLDNIEDTVWNAAKTDHEVAGSFGEWVGKKLLTVSGFLGLK